MSAEPIAVFCADTHLADGAWANRPIKGDAYHSFRQIASVAFGEEIPVIGAGDLLDKHRNVSNPINKLHEQLDWLGAAGLPFYFVQGQHEFSDTPWFSSHAAAKHIHKKTIELGPFRVYGLDYQPAGELQQELDDIPKGTDILVAHQVWGDFMGDIASPQGGSHDVPVVSTMFTGDFHEYHEIDTKGKDGQDLHVVSPGSTCMQSISEPSKKYFLILMDDGTFKKHTLCTRPMLDWSLMLNQDDMEFFAENIENELLKLFNEGAENRLPEKVCKPLLRVTYSHRLTDAKRRVLKLVNDRAHIFWKELPPEKEESQERRKQRRDGQKHSTTLLSKLPDYLKTHERTSLQAPSQRLLQAQDVTAELHRMREEAFADE
jgi:hypothetical protein